MHPKLFTPSSPPKIFSEVAPLHSTRFHFFFLISSAPPTSAQHSTSLNKTTRINKETFFHEILTAVDYLGKSVTNPPPSAL